VIKQLPNTAPVKPSASLRLVERVFNDTFAQYDTVLMGGRDEPLYQPAAAPGSSHILYYREDYFASALHESAHWCIAGAERRLQVDFGYWYEPDGRDAASQRAFERVEVTPQALEWFFSQACGRSFQVSEDNLAQSHVLCDVADSEQLTDDGLSPFAASVIERAQKFQDQGLPNRAQQLFNALSEAFATGLSANECVFSARVLQ